MFYLKKQQFKGDQGELVPLKGSKLPRVFESADKAVMFGQRYYAHAYKTYPIPSDITPEIKKRWRRREKSRLTRGTYDKIAFASSPEYRESAFADLHFLHVSPTDPEKVSFTPSEPAGVQGKKQTMRFGAYLYKYFRGISGPDRVSLAEQFIAEQFPEDVKFEIEPKRISEIYENGPDSCMSRSAKSFGYYSEEEDRYIHPTECYGKGSDFHLAYLCRGEKIVARCLIVPKLKLYSRIYGAVRPLAYKLNGLGYDYMGDFHQSKLAGLRLNKIHLTTYMHTRKESFPVHRFVVPYVDVPFPGERSDYAAMDKFNEDAETPHFEIEDKTYRLITENYDIGDKLSRKIIRNKAGQTFDSGSIDMVRTFCSSDLKHKDFCTYIGEGLYVGNDVLTRAGFFRAT